VRRELAKTYDVGWSDPNIEVIDVDLVGDRRLILHHNVVNGRQLAEGDTGRVLQHLADLWGYDVLLREIGPGQASLKEFGCSPKGAAMAA
jgi:stage V sporulation protein R